MTTSLRDRSLRTVDCAVKVGMAGKGGKGGGKGGGTSWPEPPLLNAWISNAQSTHALLTLHEEHGERMDSMHLGNLWNKLGRQLKWQPASPEMSGTLTRLAEATQAQLECQSCRRPDILANIAHGAAQASLANGASARALFGAIARSAVHVCGHPKCEPRHLANLAWAFATASQPQPALFESIASASAPLLRSTFNAQELGMLSWAFAKMEHKGATAALAEAASGRAFELEPQAIATIALSLVKLGAANASDKRRSAGVRALKRLARAARRVMDQFNFQDLDNLASAYAKLGRPRWGGKLASSIAAAAVAHGAARFPPRHLANVLWGVAKLASGCKLASGAVVSEPRIVALCQMVSSAMASRISEYNARDLSNAAWSFLTLGRFERSTMLAIASRAASTLETFNAQETSKLLYAMRKASVHSAALEAAASKPREHTLDIAPHNGPPILLTHLLGGGRFAAGAASKREETGATAATGGALWEGSLLLAKWLSAHPTPAQASASLPPIGTRLLGSGAWGGDAATQLTWLGRTAVELGAGLGLPSIVAGRLGLQTVATDSDADVLALLQANTAKDNATAGLAAAGGGAAALAQPVRVERLKWGEDAAPREALGLTYPPDVLLAVDVVYGKEEKVWQALVETLVGLSDERTLVLMAHGNGAAPGVHSMGGRFYEMAAPYFDAACLPADPEHPGCQIHCMVRRAGREEVVDDPGRVPAPASTTAKRKRKE